jgi:hypothetical protein
MSKQDGITVYMTRNSTGGQQYHGWCGKPDREKHYRDGQWNPIEDFILIHEAFSKAGMAIEPGGGPVKCKLIPCE